MTVTAEAQVRAESEKRFKELVVKREAEPRLQAMRAQGGAAGDGDAADDGEVARARDP